MCIIVGAAGLNIIFNFQKFPPKSFCIKTQFKPRRSIGYRKNMDESSSFSGYMMQTNFGNLITSPMPINRRRRNRPFNVVR